MQNTIHESFDPVIFLFGFEADQVHATFSAVVSCVEPIPLLIGQSRVLPWEPVSMALEGLDAWFVYSWKTKIKMNQFIHRILENCVIIIACKWLRLRSAQSCPSGKHSNPLLVFGSVPQSSGNTLSLPVARGVLVPPMPPALLDGISLPVLELTAGPALLDGISLPVIELTAGVSLLTMI